MKLKRKDYNIHIGDKFESLTATSEPFMSLAKNGRTRQFVMVSCACSPNEEYKMAAIDFRITKSCGCRKYPMNKPYMKFIHDAMRKMDVQQYATEP